MLESEDNSPIQRIIYTSTYLCLFYLKNFLILHYFASRNVKFSCKFSHFKSDLKIEWGTFYSTWKPLFIL